MKCYNPLIIYKNLDRKEFPHGIEVGCGKCINCREERALNKALRLLNESETKLEKGEYKATFLTFTYDDEHIYRRNGKLSLNKNWIRKVRDRIYSRLYRLYKKTNNRNLIKYKYMIAGEYGERGTERPHYHMILLTITKTAKIIHEWIKELKGGRTDIQKNATVKSIFYVAGYVAKKIGQKAKDDDIEEPFLICSKGLGKEWCLQNSEMLKQREYIEVPRQKGVFKARIPRIYIDWLEKYGKWTEEEVEDYKKRMREYAEEKNNKLIDEVVKEEHFKLTNRIFNKEDYYIAKSNRIFETKDGYTDIYMNWVDNNGIWHNTIWDHYKFAINRIRRLKAIKRLEEKYQSRQTRYIELNC